MYAATLADWKLTGKSMFAAVAVKVRMTLPPGGEFLLFGRAFISFIS